MKIWVKFKEKLQKKSYTKTVKIAILSRPKLVLSPNQLLLVL